jgi:hypothetical protein
MPRETKTSRRDRDSQKGERLPHLNLRLNSGFDGSRLTQLGVENRSLGTTRQFMPSEQ